MRSFNSRGVMASLATLKPSIEISNTCGRSTIRKPTSFTPLIKSVGRLCTEKVESKVPDEEAPRKVSLNLGDTPIEPAVRHDDCKNSHDREGSVKAEYELQALFRRRHSISSTLCISLPKSRVHPHRANGNRIHGGVEPGLGDTARVEQHGRQQERHYSSEPSLPHLMSRSEKSRPIPAVVIVARMAKLTDVFALDPNA